MIKRIKPEIKPKNRETDYEGDSKRVWNYIRENFKVNPADFENHYQLVQYIASRDARLVSFVRSNEFWKYTQSYKEEELDRYISGFIIELEEIKRKQKNKEITKEINRIIKKYKTNKDKLIKKNTKESLIALINAERSNTERNVARIILKQKREEERKQKEAERKQKKKELERKRKKKEAERERKRKQKEKERKEKAKERKEKEIEKQTRKQKPSERKREQPKSRKQEQKPKRQSKRQSKRTKPTYRIKA